ncbi:hypothetical protein [Erwinia pyrifoliae]|uniref:hypothetical protein n=1 Tax=Erwinia pyrifoliae TaxID=79967 RepID=UPI0021FA5092|nr:hypothetical protein [Erwinia pyrifoliae]UWS29165.1 hypothetical protein NYP81_14820 [Erwinia pyrifoliae]
MKNQLIDLYQNALVLGYNMELESFAKGMLPALYPGKEINEIAEEELVVLIKAVITGLTSQNC